MEEEEERVASDVEEAEEAVPSSMWEEEQRVATPPEGSRYTQEEFLALVNDKLIKASIPIPRKSSMNTSFSPSLYYISFQDPLTRENRTAS